MGSLTSFKTQLPATVSIFQLVLSIQFGVSFFIFILATLGLAFGYQVASYYLLTLLQIILAVPGLVYLATQSTVFLSLYVAVQLIMIVCEIYWLVFMIVDGANAGRWIGLSLLTAVQIYSVVIAIFSREKRIRINYGKKKNEKPELEKEKSDKSDKTVIEGKVVMKKPKMQNTLTSSKSDTDSPTQVKVSARKLKKRSSTKPKKSTSESSARSSKHTKGSAELTFPKDSMSSMD